MDPAPTPDGDAIIALGTPPGLGHRAMIRISGRDMVDALASAFTPRLPQDARICMTTRVRTSDGSDGIEAPCIVFLSRAPRSFTGEDVIEIVIPANESLIARVQAVLREIATKGGRTLRPALAGEFTARAFISGRLDAAAVTGLALAIAADERQGLEAANRWRDHGEASEVAGAAAALRSALARLEAGIDFTDEEDVVGCSADELRSHLDSIRKPLRAIRHNATSVAKAGSDRFRVVLAGPPNAGKSSLFNALVDANRTVAHDRAGTTRDAIEADVDLEDRFGRLGVTYIDTAGLGETSDPLGDSAEAASNDARRSADLELWCVPSDAGSPPIPGGAESARTEGPERIVVLTKSDLHHRTDVASSVQRCSAVTGSGIAELRLAIAKRAEGRNGVGSTLKRLLESIHEDLDSGLDRIEEAMRLLDGVPAGAAPRQPEIVVSIVRDALDTIGRRFGGHDPDAVLDLIFGSFCIGK